MPTAKESKVQDFPQPKTQQKLCEFLGLINFYHHFNPHCAHELQSLHKLLTLKNKQKNIQWTDETSQDLPVKQSLIQACQVPHYNIFTQAQGHAITFI